MTNEAKFWQRIVDNIWQPDWLLNRIENGVLDGMPDCYTVIKSVPNWIELKCPAEPKRDATYLFSGSHKLSQTQRNWLLAHRQAGGRGWVGIETEKHVFLLGARYADECNSLTVVELRVLAQFWACRPLHEVHWQRFVDTLLMKELP